ncbi:reverse transcriptase domain-containing protein [Tanacetum coccineum]
MGTNKKVRMEEIGMEVTEEMEMEEMEMEVTDEIEMEEIEMEEMEEMEIEGMEKTEMEIEMGIMRTIGIDVAYSMNWDGLMRLMTKVYCPRNEIQKMETELWNLTVKGNDLTAYTQRFQELILLCTRMVPDEEGRVEEEQTLIPMLSRDYYCPIPEQKYYHSLKQNSRKNLNDIHIQDLIIPSYTVDLASSPLRFLEYKGNALFGFQD